MPEDDTPTCPECGHSFTKAEEYETTTSTMERWEFTGTILALFTVTSLPVIIVLAGLGIVSLGAISQGWWVVYTTVVLMAATWTFGEQTLKAVRKARGK